MSYKVCLSPKAKEHIETIFQWYEKESPGLGSEFLDELILYYELLSYSPHIFAKETEYLSRVIMQRFPYIIVYEIMQEEVVIYSVFHQKRNVKDRLKN